MNSRQLHVFIQIAEAGNLRKAAAKLHIAQPALSRYVRSLEEELGVQLFDRHPQGMSVTAAGERLLMHARRIMANIDSARCDVMAEGDKLSGRVAIGASVTLSQIMFARLTERFRRDFSGVTLDLFEGSNYQLLEGLDTRRLEMAIMVDVEPRSSLEMEPLAYDTLTLFGRPEDFGDLDDQIRTEDLEALQLISLKRPAGPRMMLDKKAATEGAELHYAYELDSPGLVRSFVQRGLGVGILPTSALLGYKADDYRYSVVSDVQLTRLLVRRSGHPVTPAGRAVCDALRSEFAELTGQGWYLPVQASAQ